MGVYVIKLPDVGEGVAEAELVEWLVEEGKNVREDEVLASVMTDKATVEIPSPVEGKVVWRGPKVGEVVAVGSPIIRLEVDGEGNEAPGAAVEAATREKEAPLADKPSEGDNEDKAEPAKKIEKKPAPAPARSAEAKPSAAKAAARPSAPAKTGLPRPPGEKPLAAPAVRKRALDLGIDLRRVPGSGPAGRITHEDLDAFIESGGGAILRAARAPDMSVKEIKVVGLRRKIAERMAVAKSRIPHITYVDEVDVTALEELRGKLNAERGDRPKLTLLPFLMRAMARAIAEQPEINARYDDDEGVIYQYGGMHMGVATQTDNGLVVPVVRHVEALGLWDCAAELARLAEAARAGSCTREELTGSTITITSLGALGGVVTTPVINHPEVAIVGVNKIRVLPQWDGNGFVPRKMMNLSSSFDHRIIDGWNAAVFVQRIKGLLENPAMIFIED
ncbi:dihydrolipoamide acetyltransferase family protein [Amphiplicatus metriothermophilus]|uniref:Dihydrolipoamide acetyltransferase component of pyruvate dehydrogenase complex n=1 Tax=Amphiplicatus metriothermophilus TaxID=1519374 RepID=A0A239PYM0_9PROT|nr:dihydrolipoamide acetyltransferase family protein [Amphiplicatus metriothermophilus]MBB5519826.1 2-oxoisovalerate dehydrogenase E2 component (dihydrolipoyl transacylase) [Amphiplicatus metriothermophilus]SNT75123.1 branched-chain alpha-keto acid dehydrogenase E2 component [Amphiplicatus metriothermophilus]